MSWHLMDGLAIGNDSTLEEKYKLPILTEGDLDTRVTYAGTWAYATFAHMSSSARKTLTSGAMACVLYGLCGFVEQDKDGDWREEATARSEFTQLPPKDTYSSELLCIALEVIIATKVNWWTTNCHTGPVATFDNKEYTEAAHIMGHWASTINILTIAGIKGLRTFTALGLPGEQKLTLSWASKFKFYLLPAGTRGLVEAYADAVKLLKSPFAGIGEDFIVIPDICTLIKETPASYHIEAQYLTGKPRADYDNLQTKGYLGMLWAYINSMINKAQDYTGYAIKLATVLASYRKDIDANPKEALSNLMVTIKEALQMQEGALGVPSALGKSADEERDALNKQIERIHKAVQQLQYALGFPSVAGSKRKGEDKEKALKKRIGRIDGQIQEVQDVLEAPSADKTKGKDDEAYKTLLKQIGRIDKAVQVLLNSLGVPSAADKNKGKDDDEAGETLLKQIGKIDEAVQVLLHALGVPSAADRSKRNDEEAGETLLKQIGRIDEGVQVLLNASSAPSKSKRKGDDDDDKPVAIESLEPEATTSSHC